MSEEIEQHIPLVQSIVNQFFVPDGLERDDLVQAGLIGIWKAGKKFNPNKNVKFTTYAYVAARNEILGLLEKHSKFQQEAPELKDHHAVPYEMERDVLHRIIKEDLEKEEKTLCRLLYEGYTQQEIAKIFDTSQPNICKRIRRLRIKGIRKWGNVYGSD